MSSTTEGVVIARLSLTELLVAVDGRNRLVATTLDPRPRVGDRVVVRARVAIARIAAPETGAAEAIGRYVRATEPTHAPCIRAVRHVHPRRR